jgi:hypothetical protein
MLILILGFALFTAFAQGHCTVLRLGATTLRALAQELNLAWAAALPWELWFQRGWRFGGGGVLGRVRGQRVVRKTR